MTSRPDELTASYPPVRPVCSVSTLVVRCSWSTSAAARVAALTAFPIIGEHRRRLVVNWSRTLDCVCKGRHDADCTLNSTPASAEAALVPDAGVLTGLLVSASCLARAICACRAQVLRAPSDSLLNAGTTPSSQCDDWGKVSRCRQLDPCPVLTPPQAFRLPWAVGMIPRSQTARVGTQDTAIRGQVQVVSAVPVCGTLKASGGVLLRKTK